MRVGRVCGGGVAERGVALVSPSKGPESRIRPADQAPPGDWPPSSIFLPRWSSMQRRCLSLSRSPTASSRPLLEEGVELPLDVVEGVVAQVVHLARLPALLPLGRGDPRGGGAGGRGMGRRPLLPDLLALLALRVGQREREREIAEGSSDTLKGLVLRSLSGLARLNDALYTRSCTQKRFIRMRRFATSLRQIEAQHDSLALGRQILTDMQLRVGFSISSTLFAYKIQKLSKVAMKFDSI